MKNIDPAYIVIRYFVMLGRRAHDQIGILPPLDMDNRVLQYLTKLPHNVYHYLDGCNYLQLVLLTGRQGGIQVDFVYNDSIEDERFTLGLNGGLNVFIICADNEDEIVEMNISLSRVCPMNCIFWIDDAIKGKFLMPKVITCEKEFWDAIFDYSYPLLSVVDAPLCVPLCGGSVIFPFFNPANITFFTLSSALGNWGVGLGNNSNDDIENVKKNSNEALSNKFSWDRQEKSVDIIGQLYSLCQDAYKNIPSEKLGFRDQDYPPMLIAAPFTTKDVRDYFKHLSKSESIVQHVDRVVELEQTPNYCFDVNAELSGAFLSFKSLLVDRINYLDFTANLHCSFRFSPYLRLPIICKSINKELSYVSASNNGKLYSRNRKAIDDAIHKIGELLATKLLAPKTMQMLSKMPAQIVAITDLPLEWMEIDSVPMGFSHDICRIPETPASGILAHYTIGRVAEMYRIPSDILNKTLIVYGCRDEAFKRWQDIADSHAKNLGAKTEICLSLDAFETAVKKHNPEFLIIDTHGGTDYNNHQTFIYMGSEKVYPQDIAKRQIHANLIFISACNTAPCYNTINTIANAFIEVGAFVVTSSYMPLDVNESSVLYIRIMNQLNMAAKENIHRNWLSFISHMLRTSFIMNPLSDMSRNDEQQKNDLMSITRVNTLSMVFDKRVKIYQKLKNNEDVEGLKYDFEKVIPYYLLYTTIGRADLILFNSYLSKRSEILEEGIAS